MTDARPGAGRGGSAGAPTPATPPPSSCLACHQQPIAYKCQPCGCPALCVACARKMATGGKCKACKALFAELKRV
jgi:hypothetical protein